VGNAELRQRPAATSDGDRTRSSASEVPGSEGGECV